MTTQTPNDLTIWTNADGADLAAASAAMMNSVDAAIANRQLNTFRWASSTARLAQTGMTDGDIGTQFDNDTLWLYTGGAWELLVSPSETYPVAFFGLTKGNATVQSTFSQVGNRVFVEGSITLGSTSVVTGAVAVSLPLPESSFYSGASSQKYVGGVQLHNGGSTGMAGFCYIAGGQPGYARLQRQQLDPPTGNILQWSVNVGAPWAWGSGDIMSWSFNYTRA